MKKVIDFIKNKSVYVIMLVAVGFISLGGLTYAYLSTIVIGNEDSSTKEIDSASLSTVLTLGSINLNDLYPIFDDYKDTESNLFNFSLENDGNVVGCTDLYLNFDNISNVLLNQYVKWELENTTLHTTTSGDFTEVKDGKLLLKLGQEIPKNTTYNYVLKVWVSHRNDSNQRNLEGEGLSAKIVSITNAGACKNVAKVTLSSNGSYQIYNVPESGYYFIEAWGAQGADATSNFPGGRGAFTSGYVLLLKGEKLYIYVGSQGSATSSSANQTAAGGYNGGGSAHNDSSSSGRIAGSGGGSSDIRYFGDTTPSASDLEWDSTLGLNSRIMVAAGGGGSLSYNSDYNSIGGPGGGIIGVSGTGNNNGSVVTATGGTQTSTSFGQGVSAGTDTKPGAGSGYYGGNTDIYTAAGGSSFISGYAGVNAITSQSSRTPTNDVKHYSGKFFYSGYMESGVKSGDGKVTISYYGRTMPKMNNRLNNVRYIKDCINGSSTSTANAWNEIQVIKDGVNVAMGKTVTSTGTIHSGSYSFASITDGDIINQDSNAYINETGNQCVTIDLGQAYDLDEIAVWHYWSDGRVYANNITSVSSDNSNWTNVMSEDIIESSQGKRVSAYSANAQMVKIETNTITYNSNGGTYCDPKTVVHNGVAGVLCTSTRVNYNLLGWYTEKTGGTLISPSSVITEDMTLYAHWEIIPVVLTYNNNNGSGCTSKEVLPGNPWGALCTPTRTYYSFQGWFTTLNGSTRVTSDTIANANTQVFARWLDVTNPTCTVTVTSNDNSAGVSLRINCSDNGDGCASGQTRTVTGVKTSNATYSVKDGANNTGTCTGPTVTQKVKKLTRRCLQPYIPAGEHLNEGCACDLWNSGDSEIVNPGQCSSGQYVYANTLYGVTCTNIYHAE